MKHYTRMILVSWLSFVGPVLLGANKSVVITSIINHSESTFTIEGSGQKIPAGQVIYFRADELDLAQMKLVFLPDNKKNVRLIVKEGGNSGVELLRGQLASCLVQERAVMRTNLQAVKGLRLPQTAIAPNTALPREIICCKGKNVLEIQDYDPLLGGVFREYVVFIFPAQMPKKKVSTTPSPFTPGGLCRKTQTEILIPGFKESGTICTGTYQSANFPNEAPSVERRYLVYLPSGYFDDPHKRYPLLYHLHGTPSTPEEAVDRIATLLDLLIADQRIVPMIVVFPNGNAPVDEFMGVPLGDLPAFYQSAVVVDGKSVPSFWANSSELGNMEDDIVFTLLDHIEKTYQTRNDKHSRGINGFSGGGGGAHQMVLAHSDRFGSVSSNSGYGLDWDSEIDVVALYDDTYAQLLTSLGRSDTHLSQLDPFDPENYTIVTRLPWIYNIATALAPDESAPYKAYLPIDETGKINSTVRDRYMAHSATERACLYAEAIRSNALKIYFDAGSLDFFYTLPISFPTTFLLLDVLKLGSSYYNGTAHNYSQALEAKKIKHEFISYRGNHNGRSNQQTMSALLFHSAVFASNHHVDQERIKFIGTGNVIMEKNTSMVIDKGALVGIETHSTYTNITDLDWCLRGHASLQIGNDEREGGALQIGNPYDTFDLADEASRQKHSVSFNLLLNGPGAELQLNRHGVLGLAVGVQGHKGAFPNHFVMHTLNDVSSIEIEVEEGKVRHNQIVPGDEPSGTILAIGPSQKYTFSFSADSSILGGGNLICADDADLLHPSLTFAGSVFQGVRALQQRDRSVEVLFVLNEPVSVDGFALDSITVLPPSLLTTYPSHAHLNMFNSNVLSSKSLLCDENKASPPVNATAQQLFDFLKVAQYDDQHTKRAPIAQNNTNETTLVYLEKVNESGGCDLIVRVPERQYPPLIAGLENGVKIGAIGIVLNGTDPRQLIQVYDLEECW